jgi:hypothetical protein
MDNTSLASVVKFKNKKVEERTKTLDRNLFSILVEMGWFCSARGHDFVLTETVTTIDEDVKLKRVSNSHNQRRAADIRTRDWTENFVKMFVYDFNKKYNHIGAKSLTDGQRRFIVDKSKNKQPHLHIQIGTEFMEDT